MSVLKCEECYGETINIGNNYEISVLEITNLISSIIGKEISILENKDRIRPKNSEVERLYACNRKAKNLLKWAPKYSGKAGLKQGLIKTIEWFSDPYNRNQYKTGIYNV